MSYKENIKSYEKHLQGISPLFLDVEQESNVLDITDSGEVDIECFDINGYEFAKKYMKDERYISIFRETYFTYDFYNRIVHVGAVEVYSGVEFFNAMHDELSSYEQLEVLADYLFGGYEDCTPVEEFLGTVADFCSRFDMAIDNLDDFIEENMHELTHM